MVGACCVLMVVLSVVPVIGFPPRYQATVGVGEPVTWVGQCGCHHHQHPPPAPPPTEHSKVMEPEARAATTAGGTSFIRTNWSPP